MRWIAPGQSSPWRDAPGEEGWRGALGAVASVGGGVHTATHLRNGPRTDASLLAPGKVYELTVDLWATSHLFRRGHRIRAVVNSSNFPRFDVNPGTGESGATATTMVIAENTIYLDRQRPSHLVLPVDQA